MNTVIYSDSFFKEKKYDHQFRITIIDDNLTLDYVKILDDEENEHEILIETYPSIELLDFKEKIKNNIDIRNNKNIGFNETNDSLEIEKINTIKELYSYFQDNYFN